MEMELMNEKHAHDLETLKAELEANMRELQEIQACGYSLCQHLFSLH